MSFSVIRKRAEQRKGGVKALRALLPPVPDNSALARLPDDRVLAEMARRVFCAGFAWSVVDAKWPGFETAFLAFDPRRLLLQPDEFWEALASDSQIVRHGAKIMSVRHNAAFVCDIAGKHGSFGKFLANWPAMDQAGLLEVLAKRGNRLGGRTGQILLRFLGWDAFVTSKDVVACLKAAGVDISDDVKSKRDLAKVQAQFNVWAEETGLSYTHLSRIAAFSMGENLSAERLAEIGAEDGGS